MTATPTKKKPKTKKPKTKKPRNTGHPKYRRYELVTISDPRAPFRPTTELLYALERGGLNWRDVALAEHALLMGKLKVVLVPV